MTEPNVVDAAYDLGVREGRREMLRKCILGFARQGVSHDLIADAVNKDISFVESVLESFGMSRETDDRYDEDDMD